MTRSCIACDQTSTIVFIFPLFPGSHSVTVTLNCTEFPVHIKLFQIAMCVLMPFFLPGMPLLFSPVSPFCLTHSYSSFNLKLLGWTKSSHSNACPPQYQKPVLLHLYSSGTWLSRCSVNIC